MTPASSFPFLNAWAQSSRRARQPLSAHVLEHVRRSWLDTLAATLGGAREPCTRAAALAGAPGIKAGAPADLALLLGTSAHALDYDDVCMLATCHPSAPVVSALLALLPSHASAATMGELFGAYLVGVETMLRLGAWLGFRHYALEFHATGTLGAVGAAAACAHLMGLPDVQARHALSIAASSASGLRANFGTDTKPLHSGFAAASGVRAALLARHGANASDAVWGERGFACAFHGGTPPAACEWTGHEPWAIEAPGFEHKRFPSCYLTHRLIAGVLKLRHGQASRYSAAQRIEIELPCHGLAALIYPHPRTGLQAKFSATYCAAAAWLDGKVNLASFDDSAPLRADVQALMRGVAVTERDDPNEKLNTAPVTVRVMSADGETASVTVDWAPGSVADPMSRDDLRAKWDDCAAHARIEPAPHMPQALLNAPLESRALDTLQPALTLFLEQQP